MQIAHKNPASKPDNLLTRILKAFPGLKWNSYELISEGWDHEVLILDNKTVFRFPNDKEYHALLRTEIEVLCELEPLIEVNIPKYAYIAPDYSFAGYPIIPGKFLSKDVFDSLQPAELSEIARQLTGMMSAMHKLLQKGHDFHNVPSSYIHKDQVKVKQQAKQFLGDVLNKQELLEVDKILEQVDALLLKSLPVVLLHGDIYSQHLLWDQPNKKLGVIDFSDMTLGDPAIDFAELHEYGNSFVREVYNLYEGPKDDTFLKRAWVYQRWVGVYMMTDHFVYHKTSFKVARQTFDRVR